MGAHSSSDVAQQAHGEVLGESDVWRDGEVMNYRWTVPVGSIWSGVHIDDKAVIQRIPTTSLKEWHGYPCALGGLPVHMAGHVHREASQC